MARGLAALGQGRRLPRWIVRIAAAMRPPTAAMASPRSRQPGTTVPTARDASAPSVAVPTAAPKRPGSTGAVTTAIAPGVRAALPAGAETGLEATATCRVGRMATDADGARRAIGASVAATDRAEEAAAG